MQRKRGFVQLRNIVKIKILQIRKEVVKAAARRREGKEPQHERAAQLQKDILNIPSHVFGEHKRCQERNPTCIRDTNKKVINYVPHLKIHGLYDKVQKAIMYLSGYSDSLLLNLTNNPAEEYNSKICVQIGGKRINFGMRGSYNTRIFGSVVQHNYGKVLTKVHESSNHAVPSVVQRVESRRQKKVEKTRERRRVQGKPTKWKGPSGIDRYYGPQAQKPDLPSEVYEQLCQDHMEKLHENSMKWSEIECETRGQNDSELWHSLRREMLTASHFGPVCCMRPTTSCGATVKSILFPTAVDTAAMKYGREREAAARQEVASILKKKIKLCGLFIDRDNPCLGASPDGLIDDDGALEIKCPLKAELVTAQEAIATIPHLKGIFDKKNPEAINRKHRFFYQIQGQLNITKREYCILAVWTPKSVKVIRVDRDGAFWTRKMLPLLIRFYNECMLPEIVDSRHNRNMPIRNPTYIVAAKEAVEEKKKKKEIGVAAIVEEQICTEDSKRMSLTREEHETASEQDINAEESDDCVFVDNMSGEKMEHEENVGRFRKIFDETIAPLSIVKANVLPKYSKLTDESLDRFLRVVRETTAFETQSVMYIEFPAGIVPSRSVKSLQIIGGNCTDHWRCVFYDGSKLRVYDSLPGCTYDKLVVKEKEYIRLRYPTVAVQDFIFEKVQTQPDSTSCGIYAAAFATSLALGRNPCDEHYSTDVENMRRHFLQIVESNELSPFPG